MSADLRERIESAHAAEDARFEAMTAGAHDALEQMLDESLSYIHTSGNVESKALFMTRLRNGHRRFVSIKVLDRRLFLGNGVFSFCGSLDMEVFLEGKVVPVAMVYTSVYSDGDPPMLVSFQGTRRPAA